MNFVTWLLRKVCVDCYYFLLKHAPQFWGHLYRVTDTSTQETAPHKLRRWFQRLNSKPLPGEIVRQMPDIICTHFLPAEILSQRISAGELNCPVWVQVTDFDLHHMWVQKKHGRLFRGHIHFPTIRENHNLCYMNPGDWQESCSALVEHVDG